MDIFAGTTILDWLTAGAAVSFTLIKIGEWKRRIDAKKNGHTPSACNVVEPQLSAMRADIAATNAALTRLEAGLSQHKAECMDKFRERITRDEFDVLERRVDRSEENIGRIRDDYHALRNETNRAILDMTRRRN